MSVYEEGGSDEFLKLLFFIFITVMIFYYFCDYCKNCKY